MRQAEFQVSDLRKKELWELTTPSLQNHITILQILIADGAQFQARLADAQAELTKRMAGVA